MAEKTKDVYLVVGGSGFLGRHIVEMLVERGDIVSVFDIHQRYHDVPFFSGSITEENEVLDAIKKSGATCIIHTASPQHGAKDPSIYHKVNVGGTKAVISAAVAAGVSKLVYTSSAGVVFDGSDVINIDERVPYPEKPLDLYNSSKAEAEAVVLAANGKNGLWTVALRPAGIFGPADPQFMLGMWQAYQRGQTHYQVGDNTNLFDCTYVSNVAHAHLLAADKLVPVQERTLPDGEKSDVLLITEDEHELLHTVLTPVSASTDGHRIPTSKARPLGPYVEFPPNGEEIEAAFKAPSVSRRKTDHPISRSRFDQFADNALGLAEISPLQVAGQAFFITNGEPIYFWDYTRTIWRKLDPPGSTRHLRKHIVIPRTLGMALGYLAECWAWLRGVDAGFTRYRVSYSCAVRYHNIERARRVLGYEPIVSLEEGVEKMVNHFKAENNLP